METRFRTATNLARWRLGELLITIPVALAITGSLWFAAAIGLADALIKAFAFYGWRRIWLWYKLRRTKDDYQI